MEHPQSTMREPDEPVARLWPFVGRNDVHALPQHNGSYLGNVKRPITEMLLARHLAGEVTVGAYTTAPDGRSPFFCIDLDSAGTPEGVELAKGAALELGRRSPVPLLVEFSGSKGWHAWGLLAEPVEWNRAAGAARAILEEAGWQVSGSKARHANGLAADVFPQGLGSGGMGKLVKLPLGIHRKTGARSYFIGPDGEAKGVPAVEPIPLDALPVPRDPVAELSVVALREWGGEILPWEDWMGEVAVNGFGQGFRNKGLFLVASWFITRTDFPPDEIERYVRETGSYCSPPMDPREVTAVLRSAWKRPSLSPGVEELIAAGALAIKEAA